METPNEPAVKAPVPVLRIWLPGYHTPSLNRTSGKHWSDYYRLKKDVAERLESALSGSQHSLSTQTITEAQSKLHSIASAKRSRRSSRTTTPKSLTLSSSKSAVPVKVSKALLSKFSPVIRKQVERQMRGSLDE